MQKVNILVRQNQIKFDFFNTFTEQGTNVDKDLQMLVGIHVSHFQYVLELDMAEI